jgi:predicted RNA binding protein YcfA (HicA-like mRNA interferase family)
MGPRLRRLSAREVLRALQSFGFEVVSTRGSHAKLCRTVGGCRQILTVPVHAELPPGTLHAIFRQACRYVPEAELRPWFYAC